MIFGGTRMMCMGWLRSVGSIKLQVFFAEYRLFYKALFAKETYIMIFGGTCMMDHAHA